MINKQTITRKGTFDAGHRVMNERMKCFNLHGHTYIYKLKFEFSTMEEIGYAIDFKEIKRIACEWIDLFLDHCMIMNPKDVKVIDTCIEMESKSWLMSLNGTDYCNPTAENIAKEIFLAMEILFRGANNGLRIKKVILNETPNCRVDCKLKSITEDERMNFHEARFKDIENFRINKGKIEYDDRKN